MKMQKEAVMNHPFAIAPRVLKTEHGKWYLQFCNSSGLILQSSEYPAKHFACWEHAIWTANAHNNALFMAEEEKLKAMRVKPFREWYEPVSKTASA